MIKPLFVQDTHRAQLMALPPQLRGFVIGNLMLYLFRGTQQADIREAFNKKGITQEVFDFRGWRLGLQRCGAMLQDGKLYLYSRACDDFQPETLRTLPDLTRQDTNLLDLALEHYPPLKRHLRTFVREGFPQLSLSGLEEYLAEVLESRDLRAYMRSFIAVKMSFMIQSYNMTAAQIMADLRTAALIALLKQYPKYDDVGHGLAVSKAQIHNRGINLIKESTAKKKNALQQRSDGSYEKVTVALHQLADGTGSFLSSEESSDPSNSLLVVGINGLNNSQGLPWEMLSSIRQLCKSSKLKDKQKQLLHLLLGNHSELFSDWLGEPNDEAVHRMEFGRYQNLVCDFLRVPHDAAATFLSSLRNELS